MLIGLFFFGHHSCSYPPGHYPKTNLSQLMLVASPSSPWEHPMADLASTPGNAGLCWRPTVGWQRPGAKSAVPVSSDVHFQWDSLLSYFVFVGVIVWLCRVRECAPWNGQSWSSTIIKQKNTPQSGQPKAKSFARVFHLGFHIINTTITHDIKCSWPFSFICFSLVSLWRQAFLSTLQFCTWFLKRVE